MLEDVVSLTEVILLAVSCWSIALLVFGIFNIALRWYNF